jgi:uncharacterized protein YbcV (DUF1398 family)
MFTIDQMKAAYSKVKTGADFAPYLKELIALGVQGYDTFVNDGHLEYFGNDNFRLATTDTYPEIKIAPTANKERFIEYLSMHHEGQTEFLTFCNHAAQCGIAKWTIDIIQMTCTYYNLSNETIVIEKMPS